MSSFIVPVAPTIPTSPDVLRLVSETSIGIEEIRHVQHFLSRKPNESSRSVVIIEQAHLLTLPAQNAALKILEEPPEYADIYLVTPYPDQLLPTVLSRCLSLGKTKTELPKLTETQLIESFVNAKSAGERLELLDAQNFTRESLKNFLDQLELYLHTQTAANPKLVLGAWNLVIESKRYLSANCSLRLLLNWLSAA